eukprot:TRINITY_DN6086_c0_g1_i2.p1 TRINITY_DN6086_c0_g1~~TRINITY_DN6086_c0_g1_i2.p1  ORF type:complete len:293 (+),score=55.71 TRINITY_DN6086_c0_g1_i2:88-966(+)
MSRKKGSTRPPSSKQQRDVSVPSGIDAAVWQQIQLDAAIQDVISETISKVLVDVDAIILERLIDRNVKTAVVDEVVTAAKQVLEINFLFKDPGETDLTSELWQPDAECEPPSIDSWAPGCLPFMTAAEHEAKEHATMVSLLESRRASRAASGIKMYAEQATTDSSVAEKPETLPNKTSKQALASSKTSSAASQSRSRIESAKTAEPRPPPRSARATTGRTKASRRTKSASERYTSHGSKSATSTRSASAQETSRPPQPMPPSSKPSSRSRKRPSSKPEFKGNTNQKVPAIKA